MRSIKEDMYAKLAEAVASDFVNSKIPLTDGVKKLAADFEMNGDQIARLCEAANNVTFHKLFNSADKTATDRVVEFDLADPKKVLGAFIQKEAAYNSIAHYVDPYELRDLPREEIPDELTKTAFEMRPESGKHAEGVTRRTIEKVYEHLRIEKLAAQMEYEDARHAVCKSFSRLYDTESLEVLEKKTAALWGTSAVPVLHDVRKELKKPEMTYNLDVLQKTAGFVDDSTPQMALMKTAIDAHTHLKRLDRVIALVEGKLC